MSRYEFDKNKAYRLIAITDRNGTDKTFYRDFYKDRKNCVAINFHYDDYPSHGDKYRLNMKFIQNELGLPIYRSLHTSTVWDVEETDNGVKIFTSYSIYTFEEAELKELTFKNEGNLIELYMSEEDDHCYGKGFYYDKNKKPHELIQHFHAGMFQDSVLLDFAHEDELNGTLCRFFTTWSGAEFYDTLSNKQKDYTPMLIHNTGSNDLVIKFEMYPKTWTISSGDSKRIIPFNPEGADEEE